MPEDDEEEYTEEEGLENILEDLGEYTEEPTEEPYEEEYIEEAEEPEMEIEGPAELEEEPPPKKEKKAFKTDVSMDSSLEEVAKISFISGRVVDLVLILFAIIMILFFLSAELYEGIDKIQSLEMGMLLNIGLFGLVVVVLLYVFTSSNIAKGDALCRLDNSQAYKAAIEKYNLALKIDRRSKKAWTCKGLAMRMLSHDENTLKEALRCHNTALKIDPKYGVAWVNKGNVLFNLGKSEEALQCYDKAIELDPDYTVAWVNKGEMLVKLGDRTEAQKCLDRARSLAE
ncbi:MAG: tetratricopeptide repeat protein [Thermoplasmata archaeon]|nr:MAG: tetratricopeptide repeat protein [Thermoplasmata archaeon]